MQALGSVVAFGIKGRAFQQNALGFLKKSKAKMKYLKELAGLFVILGALLPQAAQADNRAEIMMVPTRVVMQDKDRYTQVVVKNVGNATGDLSLDMIDMAMLEDGMVQPLEAGKTDPYSARPFLRVAPHSMTLKPGETQYVRIMLRKPENMAAGEYRSHMAVTIVNDNVEALAAEKALVAAGQKKEARIAVKVNVVMSIPVIIRNGETTLSMKIESPKITRDANGKPVMVLNLVRQGNRSSMGDFTFTHITPAGKSQVIKFYPGIAAYRSVDHRQVSIPLNDIPAGVDLSKGKLDIVYAAQENEDRKKLAETQMTLAPY